MKNYFSTDDASLGSASNGKYYFETYFPIMEKLLEINLLIQKVLYFQGILHNHLNGRVFAIKFICDRINFFIDNLNITSLYKDGILEKIKGFNGKINCPEYNMVLSSEIWCNEMFEYFDFLFK